MIRSTLRFSWAISLFGLQQAMRMISALSSGRPLDAVAEAFEALNRAATEGLRFGVDSVRAAGATLGEPVVELPLSVAGTDSGDGTRRLLRGTLKALQEGVDTLRVISPNADTQTACREFINKLEAFEHFQYAYAILAIEKRSLPIAERVVRVARLDAYRGVWVMEGLGYAFAEEAWEEGEDPPRSLLNEPQIDALPRASWIPLHTGMGLLLARRTLGRGGESDLETDGRERVRRFVELCDRNSRPGYADATFEALGLVVRNLHPRSLDTVDRLLAEGAPRRRAVFWHGAGRALYFNLSQSLSGADVLWRGLEKTRREAPDRDGRLNALAGLAWALALVNLRHPRVVEVFLRDYAERLDEEERLAFSNGVASATTLWFDAVGRDPYLEAFCDHLPRAGELRSLWRRMIQEPCETSFEAYPTLLEEDGPGRLFRFEPPEPR